LIKLSRKDVYKAN